MTRKSIRGRTAAAGKRRSRDAHKALGEILDAARDEFMLHGLSGARVDRIAERISLNKAMIYYHFASKEALYKAVLQRAYAELHQSRSQLKLDALPPRQALRRLVGFTYDYDQAHPEFVRLVMAENLNQARYLKTTRAAVAASQGVIAQITGILKRGRAQKLFRTGVTAAEVHMVISALCFFRVANSHTFTAQFGRGALGALSPARNRQIVCDTVLRLLSR